MRQLTPSEEAIIKLASTIAKSQLAEAKTIAIAQFSPSTHEAMDRATLGIAQIIATNYATLLASSES